jgi:hypothetical protein
MTTARSATDILDHVERAAGRADCSVDLRQRRTLHFERDLLRGRRDDAKCFRVARHEAAVDVGTPGSNEIRHRGTSELVLGHNRRVTIA